MALSAEDIKNNRHEYYLKNKKKFLDKAKKWAKENPDKRRAIELKWRKENREKEKQRQDKYRKDNPEKYLYNLAKRRAKNKGLEFNIEHSDVVVPEYCPLLGIKINSYSLHQDFRPSIDRIDSKKGYIKGNIMVVSWKANRLKNNSNGTELLALALNLLKIEGELP